MIGFGTGIKRKKEPQPGSPEGGIVSRLLDCGSARASAKSTVHRSVPEARARTVIAPDAFSRTNAFLSHTPGAENDLQALPHQQPTSYLIAYRRRTLSLSRSICKWQARLRLSWRAPGHESNLPCTKARLRLSVVDVTQRVSRARPVFIRR